HAQHVAALPIETALAVTAPVAAKVLASPTTVREALEASPIPPGALDGQLRRVTRRFGSVGRRLGGRDVLAGNLLARLNAGTLAPAPPPAAPAGMATPSRTGRDLAPAWATSDRLAA